MRYLIGVIALASLASVSSRANESVRCGNAIVTSEVTLEQLVEKCGEPSSKKVTEEEIRASNVGAGTHSAGTTVREVWTYDRGSNAFAIVVTIIDGKIKSIVSTP